MVYILFIINVLKYIIVWIMGGARKAALSGQEYWTIWTIKNCPSRYKQYDMTLCDFTASRCDSAQPGECEKIFWDESDKKWGDL